jgi:hypothetical protein
VTEKQNAPPDFVNPVEEEFARLLDYYGIEWQYEPHTFPLRRNDAGATLEAFSPDFFLPQQNLYVELTTLRPQLNSRKNRKIRLMKELYPEVNVKLLKRREVRNLLLKYGLDDAAQGILGTEAQTSEP